MFRRAGKSPIEKDEPLTPNYLYSPKKVDQPNDPPPRVFDIATPSVVSFQEEKGIGHPLAHPITAMLKEEAPETTLGENVTFRGELSFEKLLRIDGTFEGELLSQGKVIVGPKGKVKANLNLREAIIEGKVEGNISVQEKLEVRGEASILGDIRAKSIIVDEGVTIIGYVEVAPRLDPPLSN